jgi:hypothetical protein
MSRAGSSRPGTPSAYERNATPPKPPTPKNLDAWFQQDRLTKMIDGVLGPPMSGVQTYPYSVSQRLYHEDFKALVAGTITHPFMITARPVGSTPHNLLSGSNFDGDRLLGGRAGRWTSEQDRAYVRQSLVAGKRSIASGVRSEQI